MAKITYCLLCLSVLIIGCTADELKNPLDQQLITAIQRVSPTGDVDHFILPDPTDFSSIPQEPNNPLSEVKVELGKMLFYETGLALNPKHPEAKGTWSCATCHVPEVGFMPGRAQGIADGGVGFGTFGEGRTKMFFYDDSEPDVQGARALNVMNVAFVPNTTWSGKFGAHANNVGTEEVWEGDAEINALGMEGLESQLIEGLALHRMVMNPTVADTLGYKPYFDAAFSEYPESERYSSLTTAFAVAAYLRTLISDQAPFQKYLKGQVDAMSDEEKKGALLFFGKAGCIKCHNGKPLNNPNHFYAIGVKDLYECADDAINTGQNDIRNFGRGGFTKREEDMYKFKVPQLYNMCQSNFFFHGASKTSMMEVIEYFDKAVPENDRVPASQIAPQFRPLGLTEQEKQELHAFLTISLLDAEMHRFVPERVLSGNCFPNNDPQSKQDLNCN